MPAYFLREPPPQDYGAYDIEIIAEINHCPGCRWTRSCARPTQLARDGADVIDVGCDPGDAMAGVGDAVTALRDAGIRVSIDSLNRARSRRPWPPAPSWC